ncbi:MAG: DUF1858 domain-containing protein, partial [Firmicutes bacterium]|nr:DUF1858 domain-containing protein [Bacillota bacterium]
TKDMTIFETIRSHPQAVTVFKTFTMTCSGCLAVVEETIEQGARRHGADLDHLLRELNALFSQEG